MNKDYIFTFDKLRNIPHVSPAICDGCDFMFGDEDKLISVSAGRISMKFHLDCLEDFSYAMSNFIVAFADRNEESLVN